jgi:rod shape determining protein RodA
MSQVISPQVQLRPQIERGRPDFVMIGIIAALTALGLLMILSTSGPRLEAEGSARTSQMIRQSTFVVLGVITFFVATILSDRQWRLLTPWVYTSTIVLLLLVLAIGAIRQGAQRWIPLGLFDLQPSEVAKPAVVLALAALLAGVAEGKMKWRRIFISFGVVGIPAVLIFLQPDLGTMLVFGFVTVVMLFIGGTDVRQIVILGLAALALLIAAIEADVLADYQVARLTGFLNPGEQTLSINYNQNQSQIAIGGGGMFGQGLFEGTQTNLAFVPAQTTDFIFTAVAEQLGFLGAATVIVLYGLLVLRLLLIAAAARDRFGQLVAAGVAASIVFHVFVNIGMTLGLLPVTGLPLPFLSFGGSFYISTMFSMGLAHSVWTHRSRVPIGAVPSRAV